MAGKILRYIAIASAALCAAFLGLATYAYIELFSPFTIIPTLGRDLPENIEAANAEFERRVLAQYPLPFPQGELISELDAQGFAISEDIRMAEFTKQQFPCNLIWRIKWEIENSSIVELDAVYGGICL